MDKKKRPNRKKLQEAGEEARKILKKRGILSEESTIDRIINDPEKPVLPGLPAYLPYPWTINASRRIVYDLARIWQKEKKGENGIEFFKFALEGFNRPESQIGQMLEETVAREEYDQSILSKKETLRAMKRFLVDSFAVSVMAKQHTDVAEFITWFDDWTNKLLKLWPNHTRGIDGKNNGA